MLEIVRILHYGPARVAAQATPDQGLLAPFHPFAVADATNLSALEWRCGGYGAALRRKLGLLRDAPHLVQERRSRAEIEALFSPTPPATATWPSGPLALWPSLFHWESQSTTTASSPTGQRYLHHTARGSRLLLVVREKRKQDGCAGGTTEPFVCLGFATYGGHQGERIWLVPEWRPAGGCSARSRRRSCTAVVLHTNCCLA